MMNEMEIAYWWNVINREIDLREVPNDHFIELLMMTALQAKRITCEDNQISVFEAFLGHNYPQFMINYETWKRQLEAINERSQIGGGAPGDDEMIDFEAINDSFRQLYSDSESFSAPDYVQDLNYMVDSLEDEHTRRAVHTTKTV